MWHVFTQTESTSSVSSTERNICFHTNAHEQSRCTESCQVVSDTRDDGGRGRRKVGPLWQQMGLNSQVWHYWCTVYGYFNCDDDGTLKRWLSCLPHRFSKFNQYDDNHDNGREKWGFAFQRKNNRICFDGIGNAADVEEEEDHDHDSDDEKMVG